MTRISNWGWRRSVSIWGSCLSIPQSCPSKRRRHETLALLFMSLGKSREIEKAPQLRERSKGYGCCSRCNALSGHDCSISLGIVACCFDSISFSYHEVSHPSLAVAARREPGQGLQMLACDTGDLLLKLPGGCNDGSPVSAHPGSLICLLVIRLNNGNP